MSRTGEIWRQEIHKKKRVNQRDWDYMGAIYYLVLDDDIWEEGEPVVQLIRLGKIDGDYHLPPNWPQADGSVLYWKRDKFFQHIDYADRDMKTKVICEIA